MMVLSPRARLFSASNAAEVSALLQVKSGEINYLVSRLGRQYARRPRKKPDGTTRVLSVPSERLKRLQRSTAQHIRSHLDKSTTLAVRLCGQGQIAKGKRSHSHR
jgi:hypothetical protein